MATRNDVITRQEAKAQGLRHYFTGEPCPNGHLSSRLTSSRACCECNRTSSAAYRKANPHKVKKYRAAHNKRYYQASKGRIAQRGKAYRESLGKKLADRKRNHYLANRPEILAKAKQHYADNRERVISQAIAWAKGNRNKRKAYWNTRRARKKQAGGRFTAKDIGRILAAQRSRCAICRCSIKEGFHIDHIVPLSRGGGNGPRNLQLLCPPCNMKKHNTDPIVYMQSLGYLL